MPRVLTALRVLCAVTPVFQAYSMRPFVSLPRLTLSPPLPLRTRRGLALHNMLTHMCEDVPVPGCAYIFHIPSHLHLLPVFLFFLPSARSPGGGDEDTSHLSSLLLPFCC